jgi:hypothetical protein
MKRQAPLQNEQNVLAVIESDSWMMDVLKAAKSLDLPDWWICAGFVRTKIWDTLHGFDERTPLGDIDVIYFDASDIDERTEKRLEERLYEMLPELPWSVKNQARMHRINGNPPYESSNDAISKFPETATSLGAKLDSQGKLLLTVPWGLEDVLAMRVKPTPSFLSDKGLMEIYLRRLSQKGWTAKWPQVQVR